MGDSDWLLSEHSAWAGGLRTSLLHKEGFIATSWALSSAGAGCTPTWTFQALEARGTVSLGGTSVSWSLQFGLPKNQRMAREIPSQL